MESTTADTVSHGVSPSSSFDTMSHPAPVIALATGQASHLFRFHNYSGELGSHLASKYRGGLEVTPPVKREDALDLFGWVLKISLTKNYVYQKYPEMCQPSCGTHRVPCYYSRIRYSCRINLSLNHCHLHEQHETLAHITTLTKKHKHRAIKA